LTSYDLFCVFIFGCLFEIGVFFPSINSFDLSNFLREEEIGFFPETKFFVPSSSVALQSPTSERTAIVFRIR
jgi:hypothetical protein